MLFCISGKTGLTKQKEMDGWVYGIFYGTVKLAGV
jgi:hypothetical protein